MHRLPARPRGARLHFAAVGLLMAAAGCQSGGGAAAGNGDGLPPEEQRVVFLSQCAQSVIECTSSWPTAVAEVVGGHGQTVTATENGYLVEGDDGSGSERIQLRGSDSIAGNGATEIFYSWSVGADDPDPRTMEAGNEISTEPDPDVLLQTGFHYLRLTVFNDIIRDRVESEELGLIAENVPSFHFVEFEIEVRD
ncbi:MAG: hypothetical protein IID40_04225 [Planctomycetes bacterium]|nr:hypothetical protein [Planctomycetota bacterium]